MTFLALICWLGRNRRISQSLNCPTSEGSLTTTTHHHDVIGDEKAREHPASGYDRQVRMSPASP
jgi:hypothetical protein